MASANAVPKSWAVLPLTESPSPPETRIIPVVSLKVVVWPWEELDTGVRRSTGRVAWEVRSTHFQSSVMSEPLDADAGTSSTVLSMLARFILRTLSEPAATAILRCNTGAKLARITLTE